MKDAKLYEKKVKKLLAGMKKSKAPAERGDPIEVLLRALVEQNATDAHADMAIAVFDKEFININELRVAQPNELVELLGQEYPDARKTAVDICEGLNKVFYDANGLSMDHLADLSKRDLRRRLTSLNLSPYVVGSLVLFAFDGHAMPVDADLAETLSMDGDVGADGSIQDIQGFLERIIPHKDAVSAFEFFRKHVARRASALAKKRKADQQARQAAAEEAARAAEAAAKAKLERQAAAEAKAAAKAAAQADAEAATKARQKKAAKKATKKATKKTVKKPAKKTVKKAVKKTVAKKSARKSEKK